MVTAAFSATDGGAATKRVTYAHDAFGNTVQRQAWDGSTTTTERYGQDGWDTAKAYPIGTENFDTWVDLDGSNNLTARRNYGPGFDEVASRQSSGGTVGWYLTDRLGSVRGVTDGSGTALTTITYSGWGGVLSNSTPAQSDRYQYTAREWDAVAELRHHRAREMFDGGQWAQEDPQGLAPDPNPRRYAGNNPTNATDPNGMFHGLVVQAHQHSELESLARDLRSQLSKSDPKAYVSVGADTITIVLSDGKVITLSAAKAREQLKQDVIANLRPSGGGIVGSRPAAQPPGWTQAPGAGTPQGGGVGNFTSSMLGLQPPKPPALVFGGFSKPRPETKTDFYLRHTWGALVSTGEMAWGWFLVNQPTPFGKAAGVGLLGHGANEFSGHVSSMINERDDLGGIVVLSQLIAEACGLSKQEALGVGQTVDLTLDYAAIAAGVREIWNWAWGGKAPALRSRGTGCPAGADHQGLHGDGGDAQPEQAGHRGYRSRGSPHFDRSRRDVCDADRPHQPRGAGVAHREEPPARDQAHIRRRDRSADHGLAGRPHGGRASVPRVDRSQHTGREDRQAVGSPVGERPEGLRGSDVR
jgi:RHS repeat-associated protein